ncbi:hypothetical protein GCM10009809_12610 [Isoptericola hypogeus]|uniref:Lipoprotein n=1 Tax=Isoptericola hypogeus TaxID=300179 RepID=A0ABN2J6F5_9MICO
MRPPRHTRSRLPVLAACAVAVGLVTAGCTAAQDGAEPVAEPAPAVSVPADLRMGVEGEASRSASKKPAASKPSAAAKDGAVDAKDGAVDAKRCASMQEAWAATNRALVDLSAEHPRALVESFRAGHSAVTSTEPTEEVAPSWTTMADYLGDAVAAFEDVDEDDADAVSSAMAGAITADDTAEATTAAQTVTDYLATTCGGR